MYNQLILFELQIRSNNFSALVTDSGRNGQIGIWNLIAKK